MKKIQHAVAFVIVLALAGFGLVPAAVAQQGRAYRNNDRHMRQLIRRIETRSDRFSNSLEKALDRSRWDGTSSEDGVNRMVTEFERATDRLKDNFNNRRSTAADVENVLTRAAVLNTFMNENRLANRAERDWTLLRGDLDQLALSYNVAWNWNRSYTVPYGGQIAYRPNDAEMRGLIGRIETRSDSFSNSLEKALDRSALNNTSREDEVNKLVTEFEAATDRLRKRFDSRESTATDVQMVLQRAALLNSVMVRDRFDYQAESDWALLKGDLDTLAAAYSVAWNWDTMAAPGYPAGALMTGTFRLNGASSDDPRRVADEAVRYLAYDLRQRVTDNLVRRLTPPEMLSIERRGQMVTLASTRSPQVTIDADGRERAETYPNGRASSVRAGFSGDRLTVVSNGDRLNDFTATFEPVDGGRRLLVTRQVYAERLNQPVVVRSYYDRTSDVARWDIYGPGAGYTTGANTMSGGFAVPDGTRLVAVLNNNLSTNVTREGDPFTMTVRSPAGFDGAILEGHVSNLSRGGRVTGRSGMTLNFDRIRLRDGSTHRFAGLVENVVANGESVRVDNEGAIAEGDSRTSTTVKRTAIGGAVGAILGAIIGGGEGAAVGATVGAGAGAGSVYVQGRDDLELVSGTEVTVRAGAPAYVGLR